LARFEASALGSFQAGPPAEAGHRAGADLLDRKHRAAHQPAGAGRWAAGKPAAGPPIFPTGNARTAASPPKPATIPLDQAAGRTARQGPPLDLAGLPAALCQMIGV
jgi:hypothetical protein